MLDRLLDEAAHEAQLSPRSPLAELGSSPGGPGLSSGRAPVRGGRDGARVGRPPDRRERHVRSAPGRQRARLGRRDRLRRRHQLRRRRPRRPACAIPRARHDLGQLGRRPRSRPRSGGSRRASEDGRGSRTSLEHAVPAHYGLTTPTELAEALHAGRIATGRILELAPVVVAAACDDAVAAAIVDQLSAEVVTFARVAPRTARPARRAGRGVLGGGVLTAADDRLLGSIEAGLRELSPTIEMRITSSPPIVGSALLALDALGADPAAKLRAQRELSEASRREQAEARHALRPLRAGDAGLSQRRRSGRRPPRSGGSRTAS